MFSVVLALLPFLVEAKEGTWSWIKAIDKHMWGKGEGSTPRDLMEMNYIHPSLTFRFKGKLWKKWWDQVIEGSEGHGLSKPMSIWVQAQIGIETTLVNLMDNVGWIWMEAFASQIFWWPMA